jgi:hypothetical protein
VSEYSVWLLQGAAGYPLDLVDEYESLEYVKVINGLGAFTITLPATFDLSLIQQDTRIVIFRKPPGGTRSLDFCGFAQFIEQKVSKDSLVWSVSGYDLNDLLNRRIVAYAAGTAQAEKTDQADDMLKAIVRENLGSSAIAARDLSASGLTVQADVGLGTSLTKGFSWRNLLLTLQEISDVSHSTETTSAYFGIVPLNIGWECEFRTNILQWGNDHRFQTGTQGAVVFSLELGNVSDATRQKEYRSEVNYAYAGGQGEESSRVIQEASDAARIGASPFNRREQFVDARNETLTAAVLAAANAAVRNGRPRNFFSGNITNIGSYVYGRDYGHGDYVSAFFLGELLHCRIETVQVRINNGEENVTFNLRSES